MRTHPQAYFSVVPHETDLEATESSAEYDALSTGSTLPSHHNFDDNYDHSANLKQAVKREQTSAAGAAPDGALVPIPRAEPHRHAGTKISAVPHLPGRFPLPSQSLNPQLDPVPVGDSFIIRSAGRRLRSRRRCRGAAPSLQLALLRAARLAAQERTRGADNPRVDVALPNGPVLIPPEGIRLHPDVMLTPRARTTLVVSGHSGPITCQHPDDGPRGENSGTTLEGLHITIDTSPAHGGSAPIDRTLCLLGAVTLRKCTFSHAALTRSPDVTLYDNGNNDPWAVTICSPRAKVEACTFQEVGLKVGDNAQGALVSTNVFQDCGPAIHLTNRAATGGHGAQQDTAASSTTQIQNNRFERCTEAIVVDHPAHIRGCHFSAGHLGIWAYCGQGTRQANDLPAYVAECTFEGMDTAVQVAPRATAQVVNSTFQECRQGLAAQRGQALLLADNNTFTVCRTGITGDDATLELCGNQFMDGYVGIRIAGAHGIARLVRNRFDTGLQIGVDAKNRSQLHMDTDWVRSRQGVTVKSGAQGILTSVAFASSHYGVDAGDRSTVIEAHDCDFADDPLRTTALHVHDGARIKAVNNRIAVTGRGPPAIILDNAHGQLESNTIRGSSTHRGVGVLLRGGQTDASLLRNVIARLRTGIKVTQAAHPDLELNDISACDTCLNVEGTGTAPTATSNRIRTRTGKRGIRIHDGAAGTYEDLTITGGSAGIVVSGHGTAPHIRKGRIRNTAEVGVYFERGAAGHLTEYEITDSKQGVYVLHAAPQITRNQLAQLDRGIVIKALPEAPIPPGLVVARGNRVDDAVTAAVAVHEKTRTLLAGHNQLRGNEAGLLVKGRDLQLIVEENEIQGADAVLLSPQHGDNDRRPRSDTFHAFRGNVFWARNAGINYKGLGDRFGKRIAVGGNRFRGGAHGLVGLPRKRTAANAFDDAVGIPGIPIKGPHSRGQRFQEANTPSALSNLTSVDPVYAWRVLQEAWGSDLPYQHGDKGSIDSHRHRMLGLLTSAHALDKVPTEVAWLATHALQSHLENDRRVPSKWPLGLLHVERSIVSRPGRKKIRWPTRLPKDGRWSERVRLLEISEELLWGRTRKLERQFWEQARTEWPGCGPLAPCVLAELEYLRSLPDGLNRLFTWWGPTSRSPRPPRGQRAFMIAVLEEYFRTPEQSSANRFDGNNHKRHVRDSCAVCMEDVAPKQPTGELRIPRPLGDPTATTAIASEAEPFALLGCSCEGTYCRSCVTDHLATPAGQHCLDTSCSAVTTRQDIEMLGLEHSQLAERIDALVVPNIRASLAKLESFVCCQDPDCFGGYDLSALDPKVREEGIEATCSVCGVPTYFGNTPIDPLVGRRLVAGLLSAGHRGDGAARECYTCATPTFKGDGCAAMACECCGVSWDFVKGRRRHDEAHRFDNLATDAQNFRPKRDGVLGRLGFWDDLDIKRGACNLTPEQRAAIEAKAQMWLQAGAIEDRIANYNSALPPHASRKRKRS